jgi:hypothetical protein
MTAMLLLILFMVLVGLCMRTTRKIPRSSERDDTR